MVSRHPLSFFFVAVILKCNIFYQIDFIVGRQIEVGGIYKGNVTSIKEYGAFIEFNGGQQGLLHISELSHEPVCMVLSFNYFNCLSLITICHNHIFYQQVYKFLYIRLSIIILSILRFPEFQMWFQLANSFL